MADGSTQAIRVSTLAQDGTKVPFSGTGVRIVVARDTRIEIDFRFDGHPPIAVRIGGRSRSERESRRPRLTLDLHAGNSVSVVAHAEQPLDPSAWSMFIVNSSDLKGDFRDSLQRTSAGDPLAPGKDARDLLDADTFIIDYGETWTIQLVISRVPDALLSVRITKEQVHRPTPETRSRSMSMLMIPHARNLVSFWFGEVDQGAPGQSP